MIDYSQMPLGEARRDYLAHTTTAMPIAGLVSWTGFAIALLLFEEQLPFWAPFIAAALPVPLALMLDLLRGTIGTWREGKDNPVAQLFMRMIWVVTLLTPLLIIAVLQIDQPDLLVLGMGILAGLVWVPHGWGANDPAGFNHFVARSISCYAAYLLVPEPKRGAAIAGVVALSYIYAILAMKKPSSAMNSP